MLSPAERQLALDRALVPEHLPDYGAAVSRAEPFLVEGCLCWSAGPDLVVAGYPLEPGADLARVLDAACARFGPERLDLLAPELPPWSRPLEELARDSYWRIDPARPRPNKKLRHLLRRAGPAFRLEAGEIPGPEHEALARAFCRTRGLGPEQERLLARLPDYLAAAPGAWLLSARDAEGRLAGFGVFDFSARDWAFHLFHFRDPGLPGQGAADLLLEAGLAEAAARGFRQMNLGLGTSPGVAFFKSKWGGEPFLPFVHGRALPPRPSLWRSILRGAGFF